MPQNLIKYSFKRVAIKIEKLKLLNGKKLLKYRVGDKEGSLVLSMVNKGVLIP